MTIRLGPLALALLLGFAIGVSAAALALMVMRPDPTAERPVIVRLETPVPTVVPPEATIAVPISATTPTGTSVSATARATVRPDITALATAQAAPTVTTGTQPATLRVPDPSADAVERLIVEMSLEEKLGQMLMFGFLGPAVTPGLRALIAEHHVGNIILLPENAGMPAQVQSLTSSYQEIARSSNRGIGLLVAADQEGGSRVTLTEGFSAWPRNAVVGATGSAEYAARVADGIAREMRAVGINMNLAPVLDVNDNPANPVIGWRSYGAHPALVSQLGAAAIHAYRRAGVIPTAKHFPGHGNTDQDSHITRPVVSRPLAELYEIELAPFRRAVEEQVEAIMTAHVVYPALDPARPATLSSAILTGLLREQMGYRGVIITDDFTMVGVLEGYGAGTAAVLSVQAGADIVMVVAPESRQREVITALTNAAREGAITTEQVDAAVRAVLTLKQRYGLLE